MVQPLPELFGTRPRSFDVGNADTFIGFRKTAVVSLDRSIFFQPVDDIVRKYKRDGKHLLYLLLEFRVYHSIVHEPFKSFLIGLRVRTFGISGGETLNFMLCVEGSYRLSIQSKQRASSTASLYTMLFLPDDLCGNTNHISRAVSKLSVSHLRHSSRFSKYFIPLSVVIITDFGFERLSCTRQYFGAGRTTEYGKNEKPWKIHGL